MRRVKVSEMRQKRNKYGNEFEKVEVGIGRFHQFGSSYEEFESGPGNYSIAIVEMEDGTIKDVPVNMIQFIDKV